jgi:hypothetical protein
MAGDMGGVWQRCNIGNKALAKQAGVCHLDPP